MTLSRNTGWILLAEGSNLAAGLGIVILLARAQGVGGLGLYSFSYAVGSVLSIVCLYGALNMIVRDVTQAPAKVNAYLNATLISRGALGLAAVALLGAVLWGLGYHGRPWQMVMLFVGARYFEVTLLMLVGFFRAFDQMRRECLWRVALSTGYILAGGYWMFLSPSLFKLAIAQCVLSAVFMSGVWIMLLRHHRLLPFQDVTRETVKSFVLASWPFSLYGILLALYVQTNTILLFHLKGSADTGLYTAAFRFISAIGMIPLGMMGALLPKLSALSGADQHDAFRSLFERTMRLMMTGATALSLCLFLLAPELLRLFYGDRFLPAIPTLRIMAPAVAFSYLNTIFSVALFALHREALVSRAMGISVVFVFLINIALLPVWGYQGAAVTTVLPEILFLALQAKLLSSQIQLRVIMGLFARWAVVAAAALFLSVVAGDASTGLRIAGFVVLCLPLPWIFGLVPNKKAGIL